MPWIAGLKSLRLELPSLTPGGVCVIADLMGTGRVPLDKEKGVVKGKDIRSGAEHRFLWTPERVWDRDSEIITAASFFLVDRSTEPSIRPKLRS